MTKMRPTPEGIAAVETALWNTVRVLEAIEREAGDIAHEVSGTLNAKAEGIAGMAAVAVAHVRQQQVALGGAK